MKNKHYIFTKSRMGLDNGVWLSMIIVLLISISIFSFKTITEKSCSSYEISASIKQDTGSVFYAGEVITFSIPVQPEDKLEWNFGDSTPFQKGNYQKHVFTEEGDFPVVCMVNNNCGYVTSIEIINPADKESGTISYIGDAINGEDSIYVGNTSLYFTNIKAKFSYQWSVITDRDISVQTNDTALITFNKEGLQTLQLIIDGNKTYNKKIVVRSNISLNKNAGNAGAVSTYKFPPVITSINPPNGGVNTHLTISGSFFKGAKSVKVGDVNISNFNVASNNEITATIVEGASGFVTVETDDGVVTFTNQAFTYTPPKVAPPPQSSPASSGEVKPPPHVSISDGNLKTLLTKVVTGEADAQKIASYFCSGDATLVKVNKEKKFIPLSELCKRLQKNKKITVESAHIVPDLNNPACETSLTVKYKEPNKYILF